MAMSAALVLILAFWLVPLWRLPQLSIAPAPVPAAPPLAVAFAPRSAVAQARRVSPVKPVTAAAHSCGCAPDEKGHLAVALFG